jgi:uncharacterized protein YegJ (DUF2314 family)
VRKQFSLILLSILLLSCSSINQMLPNHKIQPTDSDTIQFFSQDNQEMNAAIQKAQDTLPLFIQALQSPTATQSGFAIKVRVPYGNDGSAEHMWVSDLSYSENFFRGVLENKPVYVQNIKLGDSVSVDIKDVSDWMIIDNNRLLGGFTILVMRNRMSDDERKQFDASFGYDVPDTPELP